MNKECLEFAILLLIFVSSGMKNVAKSLKKITEGRVRDKGVTWFPELVDKRKCLFIYL